MSSMVVSQIERIERFVEKQTDPTFREFLLSHTGKLTNSQALKEVLEELKSENSLLKIGIVGQVKAGKSSLLNSLLFDGEDILPKAATPMTAALTIIEYSDTVKAEIEYFTEEDIGEFAKKSNEYLTMLGQYKNDELAKLQNNPRFKKLGISELDKRAEKQAKNKLNKSLFPFYDQYQRIQRNNISKTELEQYKELKADSVDGLMKKLKDFVGADGRYMPLTKSVKIYLPNESLKDFQVVDTPGVNDPIQSREKRTIDFLIKCNVIFIVSQAGRFLSNEDINLISRIEKAGTSQIYVIASQVDNEFYGSEKQETITQTLDGLSKKLTIQLLNLENIEDEQKENRQNLLNQISHILQDVKKHPVICNASIAHSLLKHFDQIDSITDEEVKHVWNNLITNYPYLRQNSEKCKAELRKLTCMDKFNEIFTEIRNNKLKILQDSLAKKEEKPKETARGVVKAINKHIDDKIKEIKGANIHQLRKQSQQLENSAAVLKKEMGEKYKGLITDYQRTLKGALRQELDYQLNGFDPDSARDTKTETRTKTEYYDERVEGGFFRKAGSLFGLCKSYTYETRSREVSYSVSTKVVYANQIRSSIKSILDDLENALNNKYHSARKQWEQKLKQEMITFFKSFCDQHQLDLSAESLEKALDVVIRNIPNDEFYLNKALPSEIDRTGVLSESEGNSFIRAAERYINRLEESKENEIDEKVQAIHRSLIGFDLSKKLVESIKQNAKSLIEQVEDKENSLNNWNKLKQDAPQAL